MPESHLQDLDTAAVVATWSVKTAAWRWRSPVDGDELGDVYMAVEQKQGRIVLEDTAAAHAGTIVAMWSETEGDGRGWIWMQGDRIGECRLWNYVQQQFESPPAEDRVDRPQLQSPELTLKAVATSAAPPAHPQPRRDAESTDAEATPPPMAWMKAEGKPANANVGWSDWQQPTKSAKPKALGSQQQGGNTPAPAIGFKLVKGAASKPGFIGPVQPLGTRAMQMQNVAVAPAATATKPLGHHQAPSLEGDSQQMSQQHHHHHHHHHQPFRRRVRWLVVDTCTFVEMAKVGEIAPWMFGQGLASTDVVVVRCLDLICRQFPSPFLRCCRPRARVDSAIGVSSFFPLH